MSQPKILSKSKLMQGIQCEKNLWLQLYRPELKPETTAAQQATFDQGHEVGAKAQTYFPKGKLIEGPHYEYEKLVAQTKEALKTHDTLFEASFMHNDLFARIDILTKKPNAKTYDLIEVKSSTQVKPEHREDTAIQAYILKNSGINVRTYSIMHLNNQCVSPDFSNLFTTQNITDEVNELQSTIETKIHMLQQTANQNTEPTTKIGPHCTKPYPCPFKEYCWKDVPNAKHQKMLAKLGAKQRLVDHKLIGEELKRWEFPLYFLDFETINFAIPKYPSSRPFQHVPFQFSVHVLEKWGATPRHFGYLHTDSSDPRLAVATKLLEIIGDRGSVVAYNMSFEAQVMENLAEHFPKLSHKLYGIVNRLMDPLPVIRKAVYDKGFMGSFSLKTVGPSLVGSRADYSSLGVKDGGEAQRAWLRIAFGNLETLERKEIIRWLEEYCRQDTLTVVGVGEWMRSVCE